MISRKTGLTVLLVATLAVIGVDLLLPRIPQPQSYHNFADQRSFLGIPNFGDVVSNIPFALFGVWGLLFWWRSYRMRSSVPLEQTSFLDDRGHQAVASEVTPWRQIPVRTQSFRPLSPCIVSALVRARDRWLRSPPIPGALSSPISRGRAPGA